ncbi:MAG: hypothetical protein ACI9K1_000759 [Arcticibacterium sp.]|jgi:hypothetical protein
MNKKKLYSLLLLMIISVLGCNQAEFIIPREYPVIVTEKATSIDQSGVVISANILHKGKGEITEMGFTWIDQSREDQVFKQAVYADPDTTERIELRISSDLRKDGFYKFRAYLEVGDLVILGNEESFQSQGSLVSKVSDFYPKSGGTGELITIVGENFSLSRDRTKVFLGRNEAELFYVSMDTIKVLVPKRVSASGEVEVAVRSGVSNLVLTNKFVLDRRRTLSFSPATGFIGETEIEISGAGFDSPINEITVKLGVQELEVVKVSDTEIKALLPYHISRTRNLLEVKVGDRIRFTAAHFTVRSRWGLTDPYRGCVKFFGEVTGGYIFGGQNPDCSKTEESEIWTSDFKSKVGGFPGEARQSGVSFNLNQKIYYGTGGDNLRDIWEYDYNLRNDNWTQLTDFPDSKGRSESVYYSINDKGYLIGGEGDPTSRGAEVWEFDPIGKEWRLLGTTSVSSKVNRFNQLFFKHKDQGYLISEGAIYTFDKNSSDFFVKVSDVVLPDRFRPSDFVFAFDRTDLIYFSNGLDVSQSEEQQKVWSYDLISHELIRVENFKGGDADDYRTSFTTFVYGYIFGLGSSTSDVSSDVWQFYSGT